MLQMHIPMHIVPEQPYRMQIMCNWIHVRPLIGNLCPRMPTVLLLLPKHYNQYTVMLQMQLELPELQSDIH